MQNPLAGNGQGGDIAWAARRALKFGTRRMHAYLAMPGMQPPPAVTAEKGRTARPAPPKLTFH